ncbi:MAG: nicotinate (nicotinamide) nucleotide adenylyltransferase [Planctomycetes bacterium]|nr:nicotinate (nicotinamide) nucleotide adenylyltransferase [Planctomycetota bacterium]
MSTPNIALFGGTFDPIHCGHLIVARCVLERLSLDGVTFIPSANPPHKGGADLSDVAHRLAMVELAIDEPRSLVGAEPGFACDDCEARRTGPSYTLDTVMHFRERLGPEATIHWIIGADSLAELESWHRVSELVEACNIVTVNRPGTVPAQCRRPPAGPLDLRPRAGRTPRRQTRARHPANAAHRHLRHRHSPPRRRRPIHPLPGPRTRPPIHRRPSTLPRRIRYVIRDSQSRTRSPSGRR